LHPKSKFMSDSKSRVLYNPKLQRHDEITSFIEGISASQVGQINVEHDFRLQPQNR